LTPAVYVSGSHQPDTGLHSTRHFIRVWFIVDQSLVEGHPTRPWLTVCQLKPQPGFCQTLTKPGLQRNPGEIPLCGWAGTLTPAPVAPWVGSPPARRVGSYGHTPKAYVCKYVRNMAYCSGMGCFSTAPLYNTAYFHTYGVTYGVSVSLSPLYTGKSPKIWHTYTYFIVFYSILSWLEAIKYSRRSFC
jgi:hypothetical protein